MNNHKNEALKSVFALLLFSLLAVGAYADGGLNAYYKVGTYEGSLSDANKAITQALGATEVPFEVLGSYSPGRDPNLLVLAFTRKDLIDICLKVDKGLLASVIKIGLRQLNPTQVEISLLNPDYLFYAYLREAYEQYQMELSPISMDVRIALIGLGQQFTPFGGSASEMELQRFRFTPSSPNFNEPVEVGNFASFDEGVRLIENNLKQRKGGAVQVFKLTHPNEQIALFGVGLSDDRTGDALLTSKLGSANIAALPYELLVVGNKAIMLHARYRLPLFWLDQPIRAHQQLYRSPRDIEEAMKALGQ